MDEVKYTKGNLMHLDIEKKKESKGHNGQDYSPLFKYSQYNTGKYITVVICIH